MNEQPVRIDAETYRQITGRMPANVTRTPRPKPQVKVCTCRGEIESHRGRCR